MQRETRIVLLVSAIGVAVISAAWLTHPFWAHVGMPPISVTIQDGTKTGLAPDLGELQARQASQIQLGKMPGTITHANVNGIALGDASFHKPGEKGTPSIETAKMPGPIKLPQGVDLSTGKVAGPINHVSGDLSSISVAKPITYAPTMLRTGSVSTEVTSSDKFDEDSGQYIRAMTTDAQGRLLVVSDECGVWRYDPHQPVGQRAQIVGDSAAVNHWPAVAVDAAGRVWIGNENNGVWVYDPSGSSPWRQYLTIDGLGDDHIYALAVDRLGRIWAGHLNHGVSVFNGQRWQNYNVVQNLPRGDYDPPAVSKVEPPVVSTVEPYPAMAGPLGTRVFCIATSPLDGDIWIGTEAGLTRYSLKEEKWSYFTREEGLPADGISAITFDKDGTIYVGTECDGLAIASPNDNFAKWRVVNDGSTPLTAGKMPTTPTGSGLPTNFINALAVDSSGTLFVGTSLGLAWSTDHGQTFQYIRGKDYADKVKGLYGGPPPGWSAPSKEVLSSLLAEDYVTTLACGEPVESAHAGDGPLYVGYRIRAPQAFDRTTLKPLGDLERPSGQGKHPMLASSLAPASLDDKAMHQTAADLIAADQRSFNSPATLPAATPRHLPIVFPVVELPRSAIPTLNDLNAALEKLSHVPVVGELQPGHVVSLPDDWNTRGAWLGRYGRYWACLAANYMMEDFIWGSGAASVEYYVCMGPHHHHADGLRYNIHANHTRDPSALELPMVYLHSRVLRHLTTWDVDRRQSQWDDAGEGYPITYDGPDIYCNLRIPVGVFVLSLYSDQEVGGGSGWQRLRDFSISVRPRPQSLDGTMRDIIDFDQQPELAHGRMHDHMGGVYKRFLVAGPAELTFKYGRNYSYNTMLQGLMLDPLDEDPPPYAKSIEQWTTREHQRDSLRQQWIKEAHDDPAVWIGYFAPITDAAGAQERLAASLDRLYLVNPRWLASQSGRYYALLARAYAATHSSGDTTNLATLAACYYHLQSFAAWERCQMDRGMTTSRQIEKALRWDQKTDDAYPGMDWDLVVAYWKANRNTKPPKPDSTGLETP